MQTFLAEGHLVPDDVLDVADAQVIAIYREGTSVPSLAGVGVLAYGGQAYAQTLPAALLTFVVGCACFAALGMVIASISPNANTTPVLTSATLLPLSFISEVFIPPSPSAPAWLGHFADIFPIKHFARAFAGAFNPSLHGNGFTWSDTDGAYAVLPHLAVLSVWGIAALLFAVRHFSWEPRPEKGR